MGRTVKAIYLDNTYLSLGAHMTNYKTQQKIIGCPCCRFLRPAVAAASGPISPAEEIEGILAKNVNKSHLSLQMQPLRIVSPSQWITSFQAVEVSRVEEGDDIATALAENWLGAELPMHEAAGQ